MRNLQLYIQGNRVELGNNDSLILKRIVKDITNPKKLFSDFSRDFSVPASKSNNKLFKHYHRSDITNGVDSRSLLTAEIRLNHKTYKKGNVEILSVKLKNGRPESYKIVFYGELTNLGKKIGEDKLSSLPLSTYNHAYSITEVKNRLADGSGATYGTDIIYPLTSSNKRILFHSNNEAYASSFDKSVQAAYVNSTLTVNYGITHDMLSPALKLSKLIQAIEEKYNITFTGAVKQDTISNLYMLLHNGNDETQEDDSSSLAKTVISEWVDTTSTATSPFINYSGNYFVLINSQSNDTKRVATTVTTTSTNWRVDLVSQSRGVVASAGSDIGGSLSYVSQDSSETLYFQSQGGAGDSISLSTEIVAQGVSYSYGATSTGQSSYDYQNGYYQPSTSNTSSGYGTTVETQATHTYTATHQVVSQFIVNENLPSMKVMDFLSGLFKQFGIVAEVSNTGINTYLYNYYMHLGETIDITAYADTSEGEVAKPTMFSGVAFNHSDSKTAISQGYEKVNGKEYGSLEYQLTNAEGDRFSGNTHKIDTPFSVIPLEQPTDLNDSTNSGLTYALLTDPAGDTVELKPFLFYTVQNQATPIAFNDGSAITEVNNYLMPSNLRRLSVDGDYYSGLYFGEEIDELSLENYEGTGLFNTFHKSFIRNIFDKNKRLVKVSANIPDSLLHRISLNDRLVIGAQQYMIQSIETNFTTSQSKLELISVDTSDLRGFELNCVEYTNPTNEPRQATYMDEQGLIQYLNLPAGGSEEVCHIGDLIHKTGEFGTTEDIVSGGDVYSGECASGLDIWTFNDAQMTAAVSSMGIVSISSSRAGYNDYSLLSTSNYLLTNTPITRTIYIQTIAPSGYCNSGDAVLGTISVQQTYWTDGAEYLTVQGTYDVEGANVTPSAPWLLPISSTTVGDPTPDYVEFRILATEGYEIPYTTDVNGDVTLTGFDMTTDTAGYSLGDVTIVEPTALHSGYASVKLIGTLPADPMTVNVSIIGELTAVGANLTIQYQDFNLVNGLAKSSNPNPLRFTGASGSTFEGFLTLDAVSGYTLESQTITQAALLESIAYDSANGIYDIEYEVYSYDAASTAGGGTGQVVWRIFGTIPDTIAGTTNYATLKFYAGGARYTNPATAVSMFSGTDNSGYQWFGVDALAPITNTSSSGNMNFTIVGDGAWVAEVNTEDTCGTGANPQITGVYANSGDLQPTTINLSYGSADWNGFNFGTAFRLDIYAYRVDGNYTGQTPLMSQLIRHTADSNNDIPCIDGTGGGGTTQAPVTTTFATTTQSTTSSGGGGGSTTTYTLWGTTSGQYLQYSSSYSNGQQVNASNGGVYTLSGTTTTTSLSYYNSQPSITSVYSGGGGGGYSATVFIHNNSSSSYAQYDSSYTVGDLVTLSDGTNATLTGTTTTTSESFYNGLPTITGLQAGTTTTTTTQVFDYFTVYDATYGTYNVQYNASYTTGDTVTIDSVSVGCFEILSIGTGTTSVSNVITGSCTPTATTTAAPPYYSTSAYYDASNASNVCNFFSTTTVYSSGNDPIGNLTYGIYSNTALTVSAPAGYYYKSGYTYYWTGSSWGSSASCTGGTTF